VLLAGAMIGCGDGAQSRSPNAFGPDWLPDGIVGALSCDGPVLPMGAGADPDSIAGSAVAPSLAESVATFQNSEVRVYAWLPLAGYEVIRTDDHFSLLGHRVAGTSRAVALFSNVSADGRPTDWSLAQVAACDPSEFADGVPISYGLKVWTKGGARLRTSTVLNTVPACKAAELLRVDGRTFVRAPTKAIGTVQGPYIEDGTLPEDAMETGYTEGDRTLWLMPDGSAAWVGVGGRFARWPRLSDDDPSSIDCG
jgi:hypothetical protein